MSRRSAAALVLLTVLGGLWRLASFRFNIWPHGDIVIDAAIAESVAWTGRLLESAIPPDRMFDAHMLLIRHGRTICKALRPRCGSCPLEERCPKVGVDA
jgi:hypothetical protein